MTDGRPTGVHPAWRAATVGLAVGVAAYAAVSARSRRAERARAALVREVAPTDSAAANTTVDAVEFDDAKLGDAVASLAARAGLTVEPRWAKMHVSADDRVTLHVRHKTVGRALDLLLARATPPDGDRLAWAERGQVLHVSTETDLLDDGAAAVVRVYDVRDLMAQSGPHLPDRGVVPSQFQSQGTGSPELANEVANAEELKNLVQSFVRPSTWMDNGGSAGTLTVWAGQMLVGQTPEGQRDVEAFLQLLRRPTAVAP